MSNSNTAMSSQTSPSVQSVSPLAPIGVAAALQATADPAVTPRPKIFDEFSLKDRVALVSGGNRGLGLEMALVLCEAGARAVYCVDLPPTPSEEWTATKEYVRRLSNGASRLEYISADVRNQAGMWAHAQTIGDREGRLDVCVAAAGILKAHTDCLEYPQAQFEEVIDVNTCGVLYTAQAAGRQMRRFGHGGSIVLIASMSGSITNKVGRCRCLRVSACFHVYGGRTTRGYRTTRANLPCCRWRAAWPVSLGPRTSESILSRPGTSTPSKRTISCDDLC